MGFYGVYARAPQGFPRRFPRGFPGVSAGVSVGLPGVSGGFRAKFEVFWARCACRNIKKNAIGLEQFLNMVHAWGGFPSATESPFYNTIKGI